MACAVSNGCQETRKLFSLGKGGDAMAPLGGRKLTRSANRSRLV